MKKTAIVAYYLFLVFCFLACGTEDKNQEEDMVSCRDAQMKIDVDRELLLLWPVEDSVGINSVYVWEIEREGGFWEKQRYYYKATGEEAGDSVPGKNWVAPEPLFWGATRNSLNGYAPVKFTEDDPFLYGYLPGGEDPPWISNTGVTNDGVCPGDSAVVGRRKKCVGGNQLDPNSPSSPDLTVSYLVRFLYIVPLENGDNNVKSCFQKAVSF